MAAKNKPAETSPVKAIARVRKALDDKRSQHALTLARELWRQEQSSQTRTLLIEASVLRARALRESGATDDSRTILENAIGLFPASDGAPLELVTELADCGMSSNLVRALERFPAEKARLLAKAVDGQLWKGTKDLGSVPAELKTQHQAILSAFAQQAAGNDEEVKTTLQAIGLNSPYLEWKLLLRGLGAYYRKEDQAASENWQRLSADRLPARLAAPFRAQVDPDFLKSQSAETQARLRRQLDRLTGGAAAAELDPLRRLLANPKGLTQSLKTVAVVLPQLRKTAPQLERRLARLFQSQILMHGEESDLREFRRIFSAPPDDPRFTRMVALYYERARDGCSASTAWKAYESELERLPGLFPPDQLKRARALVWQHIAEIAAEAIEMMRGDMEEFAPEVYAEVLERNPEFLDAKAHVKQGYKNCLELAPDLRDAHEAWFTYCLNEELTDEAEAACRTWIANFPEDVHAIKHLARICAADGRMEEAKEHLARAVKANPLDAGLRGERAALGLSLARGLIRGKRFDETRAELAECRAHGQANLATAMSCLEAALEFATDRAEAAEARLRELVDRGEPSLCVCYQMLREAIECKLPKAVKTRFETQFKEAMAGPADKGPAIALGRLISEWHKSGDNFTGSKTHIGLYLKYITRLAKTRLEEAECVAFAEALLDLQKWTLLDQVIANASGPAKRNPKIMLFQALSLSRKSTWRNTRKVNALLNTLEPLVSGMPEGPERQDFEAKLDQVRKRLPSGAFGGGIFGRLFEEFGRGTLFADDYEDDYEDEF